MQATLNQSWCEIASETSGSKNQQGVVLCLCPQLLYLHTYTHTQNVQNLHTLYLDFLHSQDPANQSGSLFFFSLGKHPLQQQRFLCVSSIHLIMLLYLWVCTLWAPVGANLSELMTHHAVHLNQSHHQVNTYLLQHSAGCNESIRSLS